jgi:hypothetical protein
MTSRTAVMTQNTQRWPGGSSEPEVRSVEGG